MMRGLSFGLLFILMSGCAPMRQAMVYPLGPDNVILVGKFSLDPEVSDEEMSRSKAINLVAMMTGKEPVPVNPNALKMSDLNNHIRTHWDETFMLVASREARYLRGGTLRMDGGANSNIWLPGGFVYQVPEGVNAIYIGNLRYTRDDFFSIEKVTVIDEYEAAQNEFRARYGEDAVLTRALWEPVQRSSSR